jgi:microcystin-dependent protein
VGDPYMTEIRIMAFDFAPKGWALCNGQNLPINQNQALFSLLGTTYGGNGVTTFALPDLRGRVAIHREEQFFPRGTRGGEQTHTLSVAEMPAHTHTAQGGSGGTAGTNPNGTRLGPATVASYSSPQGLVALHPTSVGDTGGSQPHENMQPYQVLSFCIALVGIFPSRT